MRWNEIDELPCSVARTLSVVGDRWTLLILRNCFLGIRRFDQFQADLKMSRHRLSDRLGKLVSEGVLTKVLYQEKPPRYEYKLTEKGLDLYPVIVSLLNWGDKWMAEDGAPIELIHEACGHKTRPVMTCGECNEPLNPREMKVVPGPGLKGLNIEQS